MSIIIFEFEQCIMYNNLLNHCTRWIRDFNLHISSTIIMLSELISNTKIGQQFRTENKIFSRVVLFEFVARLFHCIGNQDVYLNDQRMNQVNMI